MSAPAPDLAAQLQQLADLPRLVQDLAAQVEALQAEVAQLRAGDPDQLLTAAQAADLLGMTEAAVRQAAYRGKLKADRTGGRVRFRRGDLVCTKICTTGRPTGLIGL